MLISFKRGGIMEIGMIIKVLKEKVSNSNKSNDSIVYKSFQVKIQDGYFGTIIDQNKETNEYEVFSYLKNKYDIASPLNLKKFKSVHKATEYFNEILDIVNSENIDKIINFCKNSR
jgi:hypothetical protein